MQPAEQALAVLVFTSLVARITHTLGQEMRLKLNVTMPLSMLPCSTFSQAFFKFHRFLLYSFNSLAILLAMFLKPIDVPEKWKYYNYASLIFFLCKNQFNFKESLVWIVAK